MSQTRHSTGIPELDDMLGGCLIPGTLTLVAGSTGIGKTQLGIQYNQAGMTGEGRRGIIFDMASRGDSQSHAEYAKSLFDWDIVPVAAEAKIDLDTFFDTVAKIGDYLHVFDYQGRRVTRQDLDWDDWHDWNAQLNARLQNTIAFLYGSFIAGSRRVVVDGLEPVDRAHDSVQLNMFEYIYHQVLRKDPEWVARDLLREKYRTHAEKVTAGAYDNSDISCLMLYTSHETMLDDLIERPIAEGDALSNANTLIYMGKIRDGNKIGRGIYIAKHRGSACAEEIVPYTINDDGLQIGQLR